jgi:two-component system cell cycle sensor histidine kinase PleC
LWEQALTPAFRGCVSAKLTLPAEDGEQPGQQPVAGRECCVPMSDLTPEIIQRGRGADPEDVERRRKTTMEVRAVREKLTSSTGLERAFDRELLRLYAETQRNAATTMLVLAAAIGAASAIWLGAAPVVLWLTVISFAVSFGLLLFRRYLRTDGQGSDVQVWRRRFMLAQLAQGTVWAMLLHMLLNTDGDTAKTFLLFVALFITAVTVMLSANIPLAVYAGVLPITTVIAGYFVPGDNLQWATMAMMAAGGQLYFFILANRLYSTTVATLEFRAEKDALIAELEQAKANSDEARRRAEEANVAKSRFLATMSHELRTPLNAILGFSEVMKSELFGKHQVPAYREYAADIHSSGQLLLDIINEILDLSRIEAGRYELKEEAVSLAHIVDDCRHMLQMRAKSRAITIQDHIEKDLPRLWGDERAIRQVALNLLSNAIKFTPQGGEIVVKVGWTAVGGQYLSVKDNGPGIPEEEIPVVLQSFGRGSLAIKNAEQGTGLGLPIVKGLVDMHGGQLVLRSVLRQGTEVIVTFPPSRVMDSLAPVVDPREQKPSLRRRPAA